jgi:selenide,water dikinase
MIEISEIKMTEYSHGSGCGCKISPQVLENILSGIKTSDHFPELLVGNNNKDDAAVISINEDQAIISTTDFFMPIVDDPYDFGRIAATNAISDIYAMGGKPLMAISIFGWPIDKLPEAVAQQVIAGGKKVCDEAEIPLAGGHSIDSPEPIFGLAVTGIVEKKHLKTNAGAKQGDLLYLTKPLGIGILTTAEKKKKLKPEDVGVATALMLKSNRIGLDLSAIPEVSAITDVTGFGLLGHLVELCEASNVSAAINFKDVPLVDGISDYVNLGCVPGGTGRNFASYGDKLSTLTKMQQQILCDPQTSGGLLIAVDPSKEKDIENILEKAGLSSKCIGQLIPRADSLIEVI